MTVNQQLDAACDATSHLPGGGRRFNFASMRGGALQLRSRQRGQAQAIGMFVLLALSVATLIGVGLTLSLPALLLRGKRRWFGICAVMAAWSALYWVYLGRPVNEREQYATWASAIIEACKDKFPMLPSSIPVDGFLDERAALPADWIAQLFGERRISFIEIKVAQSDGRPPRIAHPSNGGTPWEVSTPARWVRLELGNDRDPKCTKLPYGLEGHIGEPPFLPDTCITLATLESPTARYRLQLDPAVRNTKGGIWTIVDSTTSSVVAALPTYEIATEIGHSSPLSSSSSDAQVACSLPYMTLVNRLVGTRPSAEQVLTIERIQIHDKDPSTNVAAPAVPQALIRVAKADWSRRDRELLFLNGADAWLKAIDLAREQGRSPFGSKLVDWKGRKLVSLVPASSGASSPARQFFAVGNGFLATSIHPALDIEGFMTLERYSPGGSLLWTVRMQAPLRSSECGAFLPQAIFKTEAEIVLANFCETWSIATSALPKVD